MNCIVPYIQFLSEIRLLLSSQKYLNIIALRFQISVKTFGNINFSNSIRSEWTKDFRKEISNFPQVLIRQIG